MEVVQTETERVEQDLSNHCPCGCERADLDDNGYCHHLMGFTNDQKPGPGSEYEKRGVMRLGKAKTGPGHESIQFVKDKRKRPLVQAGDILVNPESIQTVKGIQYRVKAWVSTRVYRPTAVKVEPVYDDDGEEQSQSELEKLQQEIAVLKQAMAFKAQPKGKKVRMTKPKGKRVEVESGVGLQLTPVGAE